MKENLFFEEEDTYDDLEEDFYSQDELERQVEDDMIDGGEAGFTLGFIEELE